MVYQKCRKNKSKNEKRLYFYIEHKVKTKHLFRAFAALINSSAISLKSIKKACIRLFDQKYSLINAEAVKILTKKSIISIDKKETYLD